MTAVAALATSLVVAMTGSTSDAAQASCTWQAEVLPLPAGISQSHAEATDHAGGYSGRAYFESTRTWHVFSWKNGQAHDLGSTGYGSDRVIAQNRAGTIVGISVRGLWGAQAISFRIRAGQRDLLPAYPGAEHNTRVVGIADNGDSFGTAVAWKPEIRDYVWLVVRWPADRPGVVERVPELPEEWRLIDVDHDGTLLVEPRRADPYPWPHLLRGGVLTRLPAPAGVQHGAANAIADGLVSGTLRVGSEPNRPAYWDRAGQPHLLTRDAEAEHINRNGLLVAEPRLGEYRIYRFGAVQGLLVGVGRIDDIGDDDTIVGTVQNPDASYEAAVWRCA
ncbi:hypothetical protein [Actinokineospora sp. NPDC004072]